MAAKKAVVVGAGFGGLAAASLLALKGFHVTVLEKNDSPGGRARVFEQEGFTFDMGPSWYLMPEVFEHFFALFGKDPQDYYSLVKLDPFYRVFFSPREVVDINADAAHNKAVFEGFEKGGGRRLDEYLAAAQYKYDTAMKEFLYVHYHSVRQFLNRRMVTEGLKLDVFSPLDGHVKKYFQDRRARQILEYAMVFLGNSPYNAPALYSLMSHVDFNLGVWYPLGGMGQVVRSFEKLALELGVKIHYSSPVTEILVQGEKAVGAATAGGDVAADVLLVNADYPHAETRLLPAARQTYPASYWRGKVVAPSMLLAFLGVGKKLNGLAHHNLYFTEKWENHFRRLFTAPAWPEEPCYYVCCPSRTDPTVAPEEGENIFFLIPLAAGLEDTPDLREKAFHATMDHFEELLGEPLRDSLLVKRLYSLDDFSRDYNAYRGTALGLAHTLKQTAVFRPAHRSRKVKNLYYTGQYNHPGVGVPMVIISSRVVTDLIGREIL